MRPTLALIPRHGPKWLAHAPMLLMGLIAVGCDDRSPAPPPPARAATAPAPVEHGATVFGRVTLSSQPPTLPRLPVSSDPFCAQAHPDGMADESVVVAADGSLANVIVYVKDAPPSDGAARPAALLDQVNCQYVPHVVAVQVSQPLVIRSSDPVLHNVHVMAVDNPALNLAEVDRSQQTVTFSTPEILRTRCDVHPWMKAIIGVFNHPCFAVTSADGRFQLERVPPGQRVLAFWHERFGEQTRTITVPPDGKMKADFAY